MPFSTNHLLFFLIFLALENPVESNLLTLPTLPKSESDTLFAIIKTLSSIQSQHLNHPNPCQQHSPSAPAWPGIHCVPGSDGHLHISHLEFGTPPNPTCDPNSTFPPQVFSLPYLTTLIFFKCFTNTKTTIFIPKLVNPRLALEQLSLRSNPALVGAIPTGISSFRSLKILTLSQNRLTGAIPLSISKLPSLVHLDLSYNMLTGRVPGGIRTLAGLDLSYNSLSGPIPLTIGDMGLLQKLDLSSNLLTGPIPATIGNLANLDFLDLSHNHFTGKLPYQIGKLQSLQYLIMDDNPMNAPVPDEIGDLKKLLELRLGSSGYYGGIPASISNLKNLTTLSLENNKLTGEIPNSLADLQKIYHLNLSRNLLVGVVPFGAGFVNRLGKNMDLSGNPGLCWTQPGSVNRGLIGVCGGGKGKKSGDLLRRSGAPAAAIGLLPPAIVAVVGGVFYLNLYEVAMLY